MGKNEIRRVAALAKDGKRAKLRLPPGFDLAHWRGYESKKGFNYTYTELNTKSLHRLQHKKDNQGRKQPRRGSKKCEGRKEDKIKSDRLTNLC
ncbi:polymorphic toxin type 8 domain-containing protein [Neisseria sp. Ec49-e6-T10]|uniref:polymorphic toxin type 8 domain-containing protein n=1 Tax=Neisseria sp. Ec49-e6-T10 TaxID=3140744 RepID=UPI003EBF48DF